MIPLTDEESAVLCRGLLKLLSQRVTDDADWHFWRERRIASELYERLRPCAGEPVEQMVRRKRTA